MTHPKMRTLILLSFLLLTLSVSAQQTIDHSDTLLKVSKERYSLGYPKSWTIDTSKQLGADLFIFSQKESDTDKFRENVNVMIQDLKGFNINLDKFIEISEEQIKTMLTNANIIESKRMNNGNIEFHKLIFSGVQGIFNLKTEQYYFQFNEKGFVITLTTEQNKFGNYKEIGETILKSFKLKEE